MCLCIFHHFFNFMLGLKRISLVHDMTLNFLLFIRFFSFFVDCLLWATSHVVDDFLAWIIYFHMRIVLKGLAFGSRLLVSFLSKGKNMAQKYSQGTSNFWSTCPKALITVISEYHNFRDLCFWSSEGFGKLEAVASLDAYQITNYQFLSKTHHFMLPDFQRIREISF